MSTAIIVEYVSKQYQLGKVGTGTISHDLNRWWHLVRGKEDPYLKIGEKNDRTTKGTSGYVWALKDIDFQVSQGEALGIIGRNGAGKSTLLKILSRTTSPTTGQLRLKGRVASLLEVGTGFHPELSGRENVYLNGAILGMTRKEINRKFDEIVDFSGVERYIDTPVKRYSSGMYVRLAFAVAAHLESEILIVDEVLAVGDADFQKKCLGKMGDVSKGEGRTVLFVSHNMASVEKLCTRGLVLKDGCIEYQGDIKDSISRYASINKYSISNSRHWRTEEEAPGNENIRILGISVRPVGGDILTTLTGMRFEFRIRNYKVNTRIGFNLKVYNQNDVLVFTTAKLIADRDSKNTVYNLSMIVPNPLLNQGLYKLKLFFGEFGTLIAEFDDDLFVFEVLPIVADNGLNPDKLPGVTMPHILFNIDHE